MSMNLESRFLLRPPQLLDMDSLHARMILAARSWCMFRRARADPLPRIHSYLMSGAAAMRFALMMDAVNQVWPEPFTVHRPCCPAASIDEMLLVRLISIALADARPQFDELLGDMLGAEARDLLFVRARAIYLDSAD